MNREGLVELESGLIQARRASKLETGSIWKKRLAKAFYFGTLAEIGISGNTRWLLQLIMFGSGLSTF
jgi:hypothetical protein